MPFIETGFEGMKIFEPIIFEDSRGYFMETYNKRHFLKEGNINATFVQDNRSLSHRGVVRGLHFQNGAAAQAKLVTVLSGEVIDVVVDCRKESATYNKAYVIVLNTQNKRHLFIPRGFAHGFIVTKDNTEFSYKCDNFYDKENERGISILDPMLHIKIPFPKDEMIISEKDANLPAFADAQDILIFL
jgi:dTDP-4-dehydrorhamnose 3,5-epimerase